MPDHELRTDVRIGHVHLRVVDLARATGSYRGVLGFDVTGYGPELGLPGVASFHRGVTTWQSESGTPPPEGHMGVYHFALLYPERRELGRTVQ